MKRIKTVLQSFLLLTILFSTNCNSKKQAKIALIGNIRGEKKFNYSQITDELFLKMKQEKTDYIFILGDNIEGFSENYMKEEWKTFFNYIEQKTDLPVYLVPGNHDIWNEKSKEFYRKNVGKLHYYKDIAGIRFVIINTTTENIREELNWAQRVLKKSKKNIILMHTPVFLQDFWIDFIHPQIKNRVLYVIASDKYRYFYKKIDGVKYIITGGGGGSFTISEKLGGFYHFLSLFINKGNVKLKVVKKDTILQEDCIPYDEIVEYERINKGIGQPYLTKNKIFFPVKSEKKITIEINKNKYVVEGEKTIILPAVDRLKIKVYPYKNKEKFYEFIRTPESIYTVDHIEKIKLNPYGLLKMKIDSISMKLNIEWDSDTIIYSHEKPLKYDYLVFLFENKNLKKVIKKGERLSFLLIPDIEEPEFIKVYPSQGAYPDVSQMKVNIKRNNNRNIIMLNIPLKSININENNDLSMNLIIKTGNKRLFISSADVKGKMAYIRRKNE